MSPWRLGPGFLFRFLSLSALMAVTCACVATGTTRAPGAGPALSPGGAIVTIRGVIEAYGSEPHLTLMIRSADGKLYYPEGDLQKSISGLPAATYEWTGLLLPPRPALPGLVPAHDGVFVTLEWRTVD